MTKNQFILFLFTLVIICVYSEVEDGVKKRGDISEKTETDDESDEKVRF